MIHRGKRLALALSIVLGALLTAAAAGRAATPRSTAVHLLEDECRDEFSLLAHTRGLAGAGAEAKILFNYHDGSNYLAVELTPGHARVLRVKGGTQTHLASGALPAGAEHELTIQRRLWRITLLCGGRIIARAYDSEMTGGQAGWETSRNAGVALRLQNTEPVYFADDFARAPGDADQWQVLAGKCGVSEIAIGNHQGDVGRFSSNAFSYVAQAQPLALSAVGYWFWDDYAVEASVKPEGRGAIGLAACLKDGNNFLLFRWSAAQPGQPESGAREILRVKDGVPKVLASEPGGFQPKQWYRLRFVVCDGSLSAFIDGRPACAAQDESLAEGKAGLYARQSARVCFDDVRVVGARSFHEPFADVEPGKWEDAGATWQTDPKRKHRRMEDAGEGLTVTGRPDWDGYVFAADVAPGKAEQAGLCFAYHDPKHYSLFEMPAAPGKARLLRVEGDKRLVLAESERPVSPGGHARLKIDVAGGHVRAYVNDQVAVEAFSPAGLSGRAGFYAKGAPGAAFSNVVGLFPIEDAPRPRLEAQFTHEYTMAGWANARGSWSYGGDGLYWHVGDFWGDPRISLEVPDNGAPFSGTLVLDAESTTAASGYQLSARVLPGGQARLELRRHDQVVASESGEWHDNETDRHLRFWREGHLLGASLGSNLVVSFRDPRPLAGTHLGLMCTQLTQIFPSLDVSTNHVLDCTFSGPPTEWWSTRGTWDVVQRWPCDDRWSFFGGLGSESPMLWTKQSFSGDVTVEAWVALHMDNPDDLRIGYSHPSDLNLSICTDGKDLSSGYSFIFAGANNTVTRILRRDQVVAETGNVVMVNPRRVNLIFQRHWFYLRAEKRGSHIRFFVDDLPAGEYDDPNPIPGGQVALWTWKNGLMVARARVWYEKGGEPVPLHPLPVAAAPAGEPGPWQISSGAPVALACNFARGTEGWATTGGEESPVLTLDKGPESGKSLRVVNPISGGNLGAWCGVQQFDAAKFPELHFDYRLDPKTRVNLYLRVRGRLLALGFSAGEQAEEEIPFLGKIGGVEADGKWHSAQVDLLAMLKRLFPGETQLLVEDLCFRSPDVEYLRSGFEGNGWGTGYSLADFRLVGAPGTTAADARAVVLRTPGQSLPQEEKRLTPRAIPVPFPGVRNARRP